MKNTYDKCDNCLSHLFVVECHTSKDCNQKHVPNLRKCAKCQHAQYCSRQCQRAQWEEHKQMCEIKATLRLALAADCRPEAQQLHRSYIKFCKAIHSYLTIPAISALRLYLGKERLDTHVFLLKVKMQLTEIEQPYKGLQKWFIFRVISAECRTMEQMHYLLDWRYGPVATPEITKSTLAPRPNVLRVFVMECSNKLPVPLDGYSLPIETSTWPSDYHTQYDPQWMVKLLENIGQPRGRPMTGQHRFGTSMNAFATGVERILAIQGPRARARARPS